MNDYRIATAARREISDIFRYIAQDNLPAAERWISRLYDQFSLLAKNPQMGQVRAELADELRSISVGNYVIFFRPRRDYIEVAHIIHGARDIDAIFRGSIEDNPS